MIKDTLNFYSPTIFLSAQTGLTCQKDKKKKKGKRTVGEEEGLHSEIQYLFPIFLLEMLALIHLIVLH